jgi:hypothetical protein
MEWWTLASYATVCLAAGYAGYWFSRRRRRSHVGLGHEQTITKATAKAPHPISCPHCNGALSLGEMLSSRRFCLFHTRPSCEWFNDASGHELLKAVDEDETARHAWRQWQVKRRQMARAHDGE